MHNIIPNKTEKRKQFSLLLTYVYHSTTCFPVFYTHLSIRKVAHNSLMPFLHITKQMYISALHTAESLIFGGIYKLVNTVPPSVAYVRNLVK